MASLALASFTLASILSSLPTPGQQVSQSIITTHISPAIAGQWELDLENTDIVKAGEITKAIKKDKQCRELYNFSADNEMWAVSGKEKSYGKYLVNHQDEGLPMIAIKTIYDNNEPDCSGNQVDQTDETLIAYMSYDDNKMQWCADDKGEECFMSFHRVRP